MVGGGEGRRRGVMVMSLDMKRWRWWRWRGARLAYARRKDFGNQAGEFIHND